MELVYNYLGAVVLALFGLVFITDIIFLFKNGSFIFQSISLVLESFELMLFICRIFIANVSMYNNFLNICFVIFFAIRIILRIFGIASTRSLAFEASGLSDEEYEIFVNYANYYYSTGIDKDSNSDESSKNNTKNNNKKD